MVNVTPGGTVTVPSKRYVTFTLLVTDLIGRTAFAERVSPINPIASYVLSENERVLLLKIGFAENDIAIGTSSLDPIVLLAKNGLEVPWIIAPK